MREPSKILIVANMMLDFQWKVRNENPERSKHILCEENIAFNRVNEASERLWFEMMGPEERDFSRRLYLEYTFGSVRT